MNTMGAYYGDEKHWENQQTREVLQEDEEHPFAATHIDVYKRQGIRRVRLPRSI